MTHTTHIKAGYLCRNGGPISDRATIKERFIRHGDSLTIRAYIEDPVYLTGPMLLAGLATGFLRQSSADTLPCMPEVDIRGARQRAVSHFLPGKNPFAREISDTYHIPEEAVMVAPKQCIPNTVTS